jgi:hypothetical protein
MGKICLAGDGIYCDSKIGDSCIRMRFATVRPPLLFFERPRFPLLREYKREKGQVVVMCN